jgi:hypothetical protein
VYSGDRHRHTGDRHTGIRLTDIRHTGIRHAGIRKTGVSHRVASLDVPLSGAAAATLNTAIVRRYTE